MAKKPMCKTAMRSIVADQLHGCTNMNKTSLLKMFRDINLDYPATDSMKATGNLLAYDKDGKRIASKIGRFVANNCKPKGDVCHHVERVKAKIYPIPVMIKEITGKDIIDAYWDGEAQEACTSCMTGDYHDYSSCHKNNVQLYGSTPEKISLIIASYNGRKARAILWRSSDGTNKTFLDRIYSKSQQTKDALYEWAQKHVDYCRTPYDGYYDCKAKREINGRDFDLSFTVNNPKSGRWPYTDTLRYGSIGKTDVKMIAIVKPGVAYDNPVYRFDSTGGEKHRVTIECKSCDKYYYDHNFHSISGRGDICDACYNSLTVVCSCCGTRVMRDAAISDLCIHCDRKLNVKCDECGRAARECSQTIVRVNGKDLNICNDCKQSKYQGYSKCVRCSNHFENASDTIRTDHRGNNVCVCKDCAKDNICFACGTYTNNYTNVYISGRSSAVKLKECYDCFNSNLNLTKDREIIASRIVASENK